MSNHYIKVVFLLFICYFLSSSMNAQDDCVPVPGVVTARFNEIIINYGSTTNAVNSRRASSMIIGEALVGQSNNTKNTSEFGFYSQFLLPPQAPIVSASQGELLDRIQITWASNALGGSSSKGFNVYRDGTFLANVGPNITNYNDFNVIAGRPYTYSIAGINDFGEGNLGSGLGFQVPNGVVTGWIQTQSGNPVSNAVVTLMPMQGFSAKFGAVDQASAAVNINSSFIPDNSDWSIAFWMKTTNATVNASVISIGEISLHVRAITSTSGNEGIEIATLPNGATIATAMFQDSVKHDWNHVALSFDDAAGLMRVYINGVLLAQSAFDDTMGGMTSDVFLKLGNTGNAGGWNGYLDEVRIYSTLLNELDIPEIMQGTASSQTPNLDFYWKMDEELGDKSYDIKNRVKLFFCGATFDADRPPVRTAGKTNNQGYYRIESASYGTGTTFLAEPMKSFYLHKSVKLNRASNSNISIPNFSLPKKSTIELWVNNSGAAGPQTILSKKSTDNNFRIFLEPSGLEQEIKISINGSTHAFGNLGNGFQHLAMTLDSATNAVQLFKNGTSLGSHTFSGIIGNLAAGGHPWRLGTHDNGTVLTDYYNGLIDEFAIYDTIKTQTQINAHFLASRDMQEQGLYVYFPMDEGGGDRVSNLGSLFLNFGTLVNTNWSSFAPNQIEEPHIFIPVTRQVTLNPSVTSVDQVDFTDRSTVAVSGYIRYKNTECFAPNVEILVNGTSFSPKIFTDSLGKFVIDFDPGSTARLKPKFEDHSFVPAFWDVTNVNSPIAGIIFNDVTTRKVEGRVAGGICKKSVIIAPAGDAQNQGTVCVVEVRTVNGCLVRNITINNQEGEFEFLELPPIEKMTIAVIEHSDDRIKTAFQIQGGSNIDLTKSDTIIDFIYFAPPEIEISTGLDPLPGCNPEVIVIEKGDNITVDIKVKEIYVPIPSNMDNGVCYLDTANIQIINGFADNSLDTTMSGGNLQYKFKVGNPNPSPPYLKTLQVIGTSIPAGRIGSTVKQAIVTGTLNKLQTFTTMMPFLPSVILRDPPGDGSSSFIEKTEKVCKTTELSMEVEAGIGGSVDIEIAPTIQFVVAPFGLGKIVTVDPDFQINIETEVTYSKVTNNSFQTCVSFNNRIATSDGDLIVGGERGGDLYVGEAINIIFGFADKVSFDTCTVNVKQIIEVEPGNFATTFVYSEFNIKNNVLRYLNALSDSTGIDSITRANYLESIDRWEAIIARNDTLKDKAKLIRNLSFDAGVEFAYSETADTTDIDSDQNGVNTDSKIGTTFGFSGDNAGAKFKVNALVKSHNTWKTEDGTEKGLTTGYTLKDDDPGDAFTVDVAMDSVYKTPVFRIKAGQSSCPWEPGTANREGPNLQLDLGSQFIAVNVPANEPAVFKLSLGNISATNEDWTYGFTAIASSNPNGAIIKLNGQPLNNTTIQYIVPYGTSIPITLTVERGPIAYEYNNLKVALVSECELARDFALSLQSDSMFFSAINLGVDFIRPCSEVKINVPEQNWVVINNDPLQPGTLRRITVSGYDLNSPDFQLIRLQYRRSDGNGAWINLPNPDDIYEAFNPRWSGFQSVPNHPDTLLLNPNFTQFIWDTDQIADGNYEIHAWAVCTGDASDKPGFSDIIKGRIDRTPPALVGVPQPSDGVYHVGDEVSFTFNQDINCGKLIQADIFNENNVGLYDATTNDLIDCTISCVGNKVELVPNFDNRFFENKILRAELHNIQDLTGNVMINEEWEFYVDRNELAWLEDSVQIVKYPDESKSIKVEIHNRGGYPVPFKILAPEYLNVSPNRGTLVANETEEISFTIDENVTIGNYMDSVVLVTETGLNPFFMGGQEVLMMNTRVICRPPAWVIDPKSFDNSQYDFSMNFIVKLNIEGTLSVDTEDLVGAYVNGNLRGVAKVVFRPGIGHVAFLTAYSYVVSGETVDFQIWDASECELYANIIESFTFNNNSIIGTLNNPQILHTSGQILRKIYLRPGWNWISVNQNLFNPSINPALGSLTNPAGATIKTQSSFSQYSLVIQQWVGTLTSVSPLLLYQYNSLTHDSLSIIGNHLAANTTIPIVPGWNWIGYLPNIKLPVNLALSSLTPQDGDIIKSQLEFAVYHSALGWVGSLEFMSPPNGYLLKSADSDVILYPNINNFDGSHTGDVFKSIYNDYIRSYNDIDVKSVKSRSVRWNVDPSKYEYTMNAIAIVAKGNGENILEEGDEVGVFVNDEIRGCGKAILIPDLNAYMMFLTIYANNEGEKLVFKYFDTSQNEEFSLIDVKDFRVNSIWGSVDAPQPLQLGVSSSIDIDANSEQSAFVHPNPFNSSTYVNFNSINSGTGKMNIVDMLGNVVANYDLAITSGPNTVEWRPDNSLVPGPYFIRLESDEHTIVKKVFYLK